MRKISFICFLLTLILCVVELRAGNDLEKLRSQFAKQALKGPVSEKNVEQMMNTMTDKGTWPGIDYEDVSRTGFRHAVHLNNLVLMARAYKQEDSSYKGDRLLRKKIDLGVEYWLDNDFMCDNWWYNEIDTPNAFISLLLIMDNSLRKGQIDRILPIARRANLNAWGARPSGDRIKIAGIQAKTALFCRDAEELKVLLKVIEGEIKQVSPTERGMQADYSFQHRPDRVNNTISYGLGYVETFIDWAYHTRNTKMAFSEESINMAIDYYLDGICKQLVYGRIEDTGIKNRDITREQTKLVFSSFTPVRLMSMTDYRHNEIQNIANARNGKDYRPLSFAKFFWQSEHFVFQRSNFYTSVRMFSSRNRNMEEPYNGEGLKNHFRGDGTNYLSLRGDEYHNLSPIYDWSCIPGATTVRLPEMPSDKEIQKKGAMDFVGGVTDGLFGAVAFDFISPHHSLLAKKSWFFFDDVYVCLGADIYSDSQYPVVTTVNQCRLNGDVVIGKVSDTSRVLDKDSLSTDSLSWAWHDGVGYIFPSTQHISLQKNEVSGMWFNVNHQTSSSKEPVKGAVFKLLIEHGEKPLDSTYSYVVVPGVSKEKLPGYMKIPTIRILSNTKDLQSVEHLDKNIVYAACYKSCKLKFGDKRNDIETESPGMYMAKFDSEGEMFSLTVSDPSRKLKAMRFSIQGKMLPPQTSATLLSCQYDPLSDVTNLAILLPDGEYAGSSVTLEFKELGLVGVVH